MDALLSYSPYPHLRPQLFSTHKHPPWLLVSAPVFPDTPKSTTPPPLLSSFIFLTMHQPPTPVLTFIHMLPKPSCRWISCIFSFLYFQLSTYTWIQHSCILLVCDPLCMRMHVSPPFLILVYQGKPEQIWEVGISQGGYLEVETSYRSVGVHILEKGS